MEWTLFLLFLSLKKGLDPGGKTNSTPIGSKQASQDSLPFSGVSFLESTVRLAYFGMGPVSSQSMLLFVSFLLDLCIPWEVISNLILTFYYFRVAMWQTGRVTIFRYKVPEIRISHFSWLSQRFIDINLFSHNYILMILSIYQHLHISAAQVFSRMVFVKFKLMLCTGNRLWNVHWNSLPNVHGNDICTNCRVSIIEILLLCS